MSSSGPWWFPGGADIDAVTMTGNVMTAAAEAKWTKEYLKPGDLAELRDNVARASSRSSPRLFGFSRSGFDRHLRDVPDLTRVAVGDLFRAGLEYERATGESPRRGAAR